MWPSHRPPPPLAFMLMTMAFFNGLLAFLWSPFVSCRKWTCQCHQQKKIIIITGRLEALDVSGGLKEVESQKQEHRKKGNNGNEDPGEDDGSYCNHADDLKKYLQEKEKQKGARHRLKQTTS